MLHWRTRASRPPRCLTPDPTQVYIYRPVGKEKVLPDRFAKNSVPVLANEEIAPGHFVTTLGDLQIAEKSNPGQFYQVRLTGPSAPFLPRPFSIFDWHREAGGELVGFKILYKVIGKGTAGLSQLVPAETVAVTGPLGNAFDPPEPGKRVLIAAGGIGIAPFLAFVRRCIDDGTKPEEITVLYGARTAALLVAADAFEALGVEVRRITDDGSSGRQGTVVDLLDGRLKECGVDRSQVYGSGPMPMLRALAAFSCRCGVRAQLTLEARMICGLAVCNSCAVQVVSRKDPDGWEYKLVCRDGPVFNAETLYVERPA